MSQIFAIIPFLQLLWFGGGLVLQLKGHVKGTQKYIMLVVGLLQLSFWSLQLAPWGEGMEKLSRLSPVFLNASYFALLGLSLLAFKDKSAGPRQRQRAIAWKLPLLGGLLSFTVMKGPHAELYLLSVFLLVNIIHMLFLSRHKLHHPLVYRSAFGAGVSGLLLAVGLPYQLHLLIFGVLTNMFVIQIVNYWGVQSLIQQKLLPSGAP